MLERIESALCYCQTENGGRRRSRELRGREEEKRRGGEERRGEGGWARGWGGGVVKVQKRRKRTPRGKGSEMEKVSRDGRVTGESEPSTHTHTHTHT